MSTIVATGTEFTRTDAPVAARRPRFDVVELLRGLVIVADGAGPTRDFLHAQAFTLNPTDPAHTTLIILYLTRLAANLCAPTFVFLASVSIELQRANGKTLAELSRFLLARGLWLIVRRVSREQPIRAARGCAAGRGARRTALLSRRPRSAARAHRGAGAGAAE